MNEGIVQQVLNKLKELSIDNSNVIAEIKSESNRVLREFSEHVKEQWAKVSETVNEVFDKRINELPCKIHIDDLKGIKKEIKDHDDKLKDLTRRVIRQEKATSINRIIVTCDNFYAKHAHTTYGKFILIIGLIGVLILIII